MSRRSRHDPDIDFGDDTPQGSFQAHRSIHLSRDGTRVVSGLQNLRPQKRARGPEDLGDTYAGWTPVADDPGDDLDAVHAVADTVTSYDVSLDDVADGGKRKCYTSSVRRLTELIRGCGNSP
jgi:hypothetical protein